MRFGSLGLALPPREQPVDPIDLVVGDTGKNSLRWDKQADLGSTFSHEILHARCEVHRCLIHRIVACVCDHRQAGLGEPSQISLLHCRLGKSWIVLPDQNEYGQLKASNFIGEVCLRPSDQIIGKSITGCRFSGAFYFVVEPRSRVASACHEVEYCSPIVITVRGTLEAGTRVIATPHLARCVVSSATRCIAISPMECPRMCKRAQLK